MIGRRPTTEAGRKRVLIVDDDAVIRSLIAVILRGAGFEIAEAPSGRDALNLARAFQPHVVTLDAAMPMLSGLDVAALLRSDPQTCLVKILLIVSSSHPAAAVAVLIDARLDKPFAPDALVTAVCDLVGRSPKRVPFV